jgi:hypothetical protein
MRGQMHGAAFSQSKTTLRELTLGKQQLSNRPRSAGSNVASTQEISATTSSRVPFSTTPANEIAVAFRTFMLSLSGNSSQYFFSQHQQRSLKLGKPESTSPATDTQLNPSELEPDILSLNLSPVLGQNRSALQHMRQFAHVPRPIMLHQPLRRPGRKPLHLHLFA